MKLSECKIGTIVKRKTNKDIGHIVGLTKNPCGEVIPQIDWQIHGIDIALPHIYPCHYDNLEIPNF